MKISIQNHTLSELIFDVLNKLSELEDSQKTSKFTKDMIDLKLKLIFKKHLFDIPITNSCLQCIQKDLLIELCKHDYISISLVKNYHTQIENINNAVTNTILNKLSCQPSQQKI